MEKEKLFENLDGQCDILVVHAEGKDYAVAAPSFEANVGHLVEFRVADRMTLIGQVKDLMSCKQFDDRWNCVPAFTRIHKAVAIYHVSWSEDT